MKKPNVTRKMIQNAIKNNQLGNLVRLLINYRYNVNTNDPNGGLRNCYNSLVKIGMRYGIDHHAPIGISLKKTLTLFPTL